MLYSTNTIHSESCEMIRELPRLIPAKRLDLITKVQLLYVFPSTDTGERMRDTSGKARERVLQRFADFVRLLPSVLPAATSIFLGMQMPVQQYDERVERNSAWYKGTSDVLLRPIDELFMGKKLGAHIKELTVSMPSTCYRSRRNRAIQQGLVVEQDCRGQLERHWRQVDKTSHPGYWVALGQNPLVIFWGCSMGGPPPPNPWPNEDEILQGYYSK